MSRESSSLVSMARGAVLASLALALAGCGEEPTPPRLIGFSPAVLTVPANQALAVSVEYEENDFSLQDFQWTADAGEIEGNGAPSITYHAPADPGDYKVTVTVTYGDDAAPLSLESAIAVTAAVATEAPAVSETTEPETSPAEPGQSAEPAATATAEEPAAPTAADPAQAVEEAAPAAEETAAPTAAARVVEEGGRSHRHRGRPSRRGSGGRHRAGDRGGRGSGRDRHRTGHRIGRGDRNGHRRRDPGGGRGCRGRDRRSG